MSQIRAFSPALEGVFSRPPAEGLVGLRMSEFPLGSATCRTWLAEGSGSARPRPENQEALGVRRRRVNPEKSGCHRPAEMRVQCQ